MFKNSLHVQTLPPWLSFMFCASFKLGKYDIHILEYKYKNNGNT